MGCPFAETKNTSEFRLEITEASVLTNISITPSSTVNGANNTWQVDFIPDVDLYQNDTLVFNFPQEIGIPSNVQCKPLSGTSFLRSATCKKVANLTLNSLEVTLVFSIPIDISNYLAAGTLVSFTIS
jgi:hypothetical protein